MRNTAPDPRVANAAWDRRETQALDPPEAMAQDQGRRAPIRTPPTTAAFPIGEQKIAQMPAGGEISARILRLGLRLLLWDDGTGAGAWRVVDSI